MEKMQIIAIVLMGLLTVKLLLLPIRATGRESLGRARWLSAACTALLVLHFVVQFKLQLRDTGHVAQALLLNLATFIPCSALLSVAILYLLRHEYITKLDRFIGIPTWIGAMALLGFGLSDGSTPIIDESVQLKWCEAGAGCLYAAMQFYYFIRHMHELRALRQALANYYDRESDGMLGWMHTGIVLLALIALMVPPLIFTNGWWLAVFGVTIFLGIFYLVDNFCLYVVSSASKKVREAEQNAFDVETEEAGEEKNKVEAPTTNISDDVMEKVELATTRWIMQGGYRHNGIKMPNAAEEMGVLRYQLSQWLHYKGLRYTDWITDLRIEEAKRVLKAHDWNNESVAQHCGFNDRSYFQSVFKKKTGMTPSEYLQEQQTTT